VCAGRRTPRAAEDKRRARAAHSRRAARVDAIRHGEVEKARVDAENRAQPQLQQQQAHERELGSSAKTAKKRLVLPAVAAGVLLLGGIVTGGVFYSKARSASASSSAQLIDLTSKKRTIGR
jgi:colicin import membrane protein